MIQLLSKKSAVKLSLYGLLATSAFLLFYRISWLCDDAFITFRVVDNFTNGYGLRWNIDERVQVFTHPLWALLLVAIHWLTGELITSVQYLSIVLSIAVLVLVAAVIPSKTRAIVAVCLLLCSRSFVDFSSSGLENPLSHLLAAGFMLVLSKNLNHNRRYWICCALAGMALLNRMDTLLLYLPFLVFDFPLKRWRQGGLALAAGFLPFILWEAFSLFYYGFLFPNTAYAKLNLWHLNNWNVQLDGLRYAYVSLIGDPLSQTIMVGAIAVAVWQRRRRSLLLISGAFFYWGYSIYIGGDFMSGRFYSAPVVIAITCALTDWPKVSVRASNKSATNSPVKPNAPEGPARMVLAVPDEPARGRKPVLRDELAGVVSIHQYPPERLRPKGYLRTGIAAIGVCLTLTALGNLPPPLLALRGQGGVVDTYLTKSGVHDERFWAVARLSSFAPKISDSQLTKLGKDFASIARRHRAQNEVRILIPIGVIGYFAGPDTRIVDLPALADPLLARLPPLIGNYGHFARALPTGYLETLRTGKNEIKKAGIAEYYSFLRFVTRGPLWSCERFTQSILFNLGKYRKLLVRDAYDRGEEFVQDLVIHNPTSAAEVTVYVWHAGQTTKYLLDTASYRNKQYRVRFVLRANSATLTTEHIGILENNIDTLYDDGVFSISVAFTNPGGLRTSIYERRYSYIRSGNELAVVHGWHGAMIDNLQTGQWRERGHPRWRYDDIIADYAP